MRHDKKARNSKAEMLQQGRSKYAMYDVDYTIQCVGCIRMYKSMVGNACPTAVHDTWCIAVQALEIPLCVRYSPVPRVFTHTRAKVMKLFTGTYPVVEDNV